MHISEHKSHHRTNVPAASQSVSKKSEVRSAAAIDQPAAHASIQRFAVQQFRPQRFNPRISEPNPLKDGDRRYWKANPSGFQRGQDYWNSNKAEYKKNKDGKEVHATINSLTEVEKGEKLRDYVKEKDRGWAGRPEAVGNRINIDRWTTRRKKINKWHISLKDGAANVGGWFNISGSDALPAYTNNGGAATAGQITTATNIRTNMNDKVI